MQWARYRFAPAWWAWALFATGVAIFCSMGLWQIERAQYKTELQAEQDDARAAGVGRISADNTGTAEAPTRFRYTREFEVRGRYQAGRSILLADQMRGTEVGYRVWTPLLLDNAFRVMVDRGWIRRDRLEASDDVLATSDGPVTVSGVWVALPQPGFAWGETVCDPQAWPRTLSFPDIATLRCQYPGPVLDGLLLLDPEAPDGFVREWENDRDTVGLPAFGHYAYASQWFLMAFVVGVIFVVVNLRRADRDTAT